MHISCEKCATTYLLDDSLIPPQGAPVQCTRCGHVFTAKLPAKDVATTQPGQPTWEKRPGGGTIAFGQPAGGAPPSNQTLVFGAAGAKGAPPPASAPAGKQTMVFGAANPPAAAPPAGKQTMVFGAANPPAAAAAQPAGKQTMVFGAANPPAPAAAPPAGKQTMVFGAANPPAAAAAPPAGKQTMVFGAATPAAPPPAGKQTMVFGAATPPAAASQPAGKQTMVFGAAAAPAPEAQASSAAANRTMMFGRSPAVPPAAEAPQERSESTVRVDLEAMMRGQGAEDFAATQARHDRTQRYAMTEPGPPPASAPAAESVESRHNRTQLFAMTAQQETTKPDGNVPPPPNPADWGQRPGDSTLPPSFAEMPTLEPEAPGHPAPAPLGQTLMFGARGPQPSTDPGLDPPGVRVLLEPGMVTPPEAHAAHPEPIATTLPNLAPIERAQELPPLRVDLPPEPTFPNSQSPTQRSLEAPSAGDDAAIAEMKKSAGRRTALAVIAFLVVALGLGLALLWHLFGRSLLGATTVDPDHAAVEEAVSMMRMDDTDSRDAALKKLHAIQKARPDFVEARAGVVLALALAFDDETARLAAIKEKVEQGRAESKLIGPATQRRTAAQVALQNEYELLTRLPSKPAPGSPAELAVLRATAMAQAALGEPEALGTVEEHHQHSQDTDDWVDLAIGQYQAVRATDVEAGLRELEQIRNRKTNSTFFRVLMLTARLQLHANQPAAAEETLKTVTTLNSKHELAALMFDVVSKRGDARQGPSAARDAALDGK